MSEGEGVCLTLCVLPLAVDAYRLPLPVGIPGETKQ